MMHFLVSVFLLALSLRISSVVGATAPGCVIPGDQKCGGRCYNPSTHVCTNAGTEFLCPVAYPNQCGTGCYSSTQYSCDNGQLKPIGSGPAVTQPPATSAPTAVAGCVLIGDLRCGSRCYNPNTHVCTNAGSSFLCPVAYPNQCGANCYSSNQYTCDNGQLKPGGSGPAVTQPPATTSAPTAVPGCVLIGDLKCGTRCYSPATHVCADAGSSFLCPTAFPSKCGAGCYSPTQYSCDNGQLKPVGVGPAVTQPPVTTSAPTAVAGCVLIGDLRCGSRCYNPNTHVCTNAGTQFLCPVAYPNQCGAGCYSSTQYTCENGQLKPVGSAPAVTQPPATSAPTAVPGCVLIGDLKCGTRCYNPSTHVCADAGSNFLCPKAFPSKCGDACYSPSQYKCENGQLKGL